MTRQERRALERKQRKLARKQSNQQSQASNTEALNIPQPGGLFPSLADITPAVQQIASPISEAQLAANRENAQKSTGPTSEAGRATSSQNRTVHGLARHNTEFRLLPSEDPNGFEGLKASLSAEHQPTTETEAILVRIMAESSWLAERAEKLQQDTCTDPQTGVITNEKLFSLYMRYHSKHERAFHKSLNDLLKLRKETRTAENGFEAQERKAEELRIKSEQHEMKKHGHFWDLLFKDGKACHQLIMNLQQKDRGSKENPGFEAQYAAELEKHGLKERRGPHVAAVAA